MHQFRKLENESTPEIYVRLAFWSEDVFRVSYSERPIPDAEPDFPKPGHGMLVGSPQEVDLRITEQTDRWQIATEATPAVVIEPVTGASL